MKCYVAKQPIFDIDLNVFAYELLFRSGFENYYNALDSDKATACVISSGYLSIGIDELTNGTKAFINFSNNLLLQKVATLFPPNLLAVELSSDIKLNDKIISECNELVKNGYQIALDDFSNDADIEELLDYCDIIKVDFQKNDRNTCKQVFDLYKNKNMIFLAEKIETEEEFKQAKRWGYTLFQGFFFCKPIISEGGIVPEYKLSNMQLLNEIYKPEPELEDIENIIKHDVSLSYKLLRLINSASFGLSTEVKSIRHALVLLGEKEIKKWVTLIALSKLAEDKPFELIRISYNRAKFCEELAARTDFSPRKSEFYLMGLFSLIDVILEKPMFQILDKLPLSDDIKTALFGTENKAKKILDIAVQYEQGNWNRLFTFIEQCGINVNEIPRLFLESIKATSQILTNDFTEIARSKKLFVQYAQ